MKLLVWHWGRRGAGPIFAVRLARGLNAQLSLPDGAEILEGSRAPHCDWREPTYKTKWGYIVQRLLGPFYRLRTIAHLRAIAPDFALCAMPALLDTRMVGALKALQISYGVIVHDATAHPGDKLSFLALNQIQLLRGAKHLFCLSTHVEQQLLGQGFGKNGQTLTKLWHPPFTFEAAIPEIQPTTKPKLLYFGRLSSYKGLDLFADALEMLGNSQAFTVRICGDGPSIPVLERFRRISGVSVEHRWFTDEELPGLLTWADAVVLPYREASQSGVAALALAAGRFVLATKVGGLPEQLANQPMALFCEPEAADIAQGLVNLAACLLDPPPKIQAPTMDWESMAQEIRAVCEGDGPQSNTRKGGVFASLPIS